MQQMYLSDSKNIFSRTLIVFFILCILICTHSCDVHSKQIANADEINIIVSILPEIADTASYLEQQQTVSIDSIKKIKGNEMRTIAVFDKMENIYEWETSILTELGNQNSSFKQNTFLEYQKVLSENRNDTLQKDLQVDKLSMNNFKILPYKDKSERNIKGTISRVKFSRILFDNKKGLAIVVVYTANNIKSGKTKVVFLEKIENKWVVMSDPVVERS